MARWVESTPVYYLQNIIESGELWHCERDKPLQPDE
jgi:hypothetical protein